MEGIDAELEHQKEQIQNESKPIYNVWCFFIVLELLQLKASSNLEGEELDHDLNELNEHYNELV